MPTRADSLPVCSCCAGQEAPPWAVRMLAMLELLLQSKKRTKPEASRLASLPITDAEKEAGELFVALGSVSAVARDLGISRKAVRDRLKAAWIKACGAGLGDTVRFMAPRAKKQRLPTDERGQVTTVPKRGKPRGGGRLLEG